jgi:hypothetical protein
MGEIMNNIKNITKIIAIFFILNLLLYACGKSLEEKQADIGKEVFFNKDYEKAKTLAYEYFGKNTSDYIAYITMIKNEEAKEYLQYIKIQDGWKWYVDNGYIYIDGRVKNNGNKTIRYFEINASFKNKSNEIVDTDYTNSGEELIPGSMKSFNIMHRNSSDIKYISLQVKNISLK